MKITPLFALTSFMMISLIGSHCVRKTNGGGYISYYLPASNGLKDWKPVGQPQKFEGEDLFLYINGGAEIYHEYGFTQVITQEYRNKKGKTINLELYEMEDSSSAYGIFTFKKGDIGQKIRIGNDAFLEEYYLNFWKGNVLVTVTGFDSERETMDGLISIAEATDARIKTQGQKPPLPVLLPRKNLNVNSIKYVKGNLGLVNHYAFDSENIFGVKEGITGDYGTFEVFLFQYDDENESLKWYEYARDHLENNPKFHNFANSDSAFSVIDDEGKPIHVEPYLNDIIIILGKKQIDAAIFLAEMKESIRETMTIEE